MVELETKAMPFEDINFRCESIVKSESGAENFVPMSAGSKTLFTNISLCPDFLLIADK